jgi:hypothetical protein
LLAFHSLLRQAPSSTQSHRCVLCRGLPAAGGTATAFELLAAALADDPTCNVTLVGIADRLEDRAAAVQAHSQTRRANFRFELVAPDAGLENVTRTHTHEATGLAALRWLEQHQGECDIVHGEREYLALVQNEPERCTGRALTNCMQDMSGADSWRQYSFTMHSPGSGRACR